MEPSGGGVAAKRTKASSDDASAGGEDRLSALPDDALVLILLRLSTEEAARTSVLSHWWQHVWTLLPELRYRVAEDPHLLRDTLSASDVPLRTLLVGIPDASSQSLAAWLPAAARRVSGKHVLLNSVERRAADSDKEEEEAFELPCFEKATTIALYLGFLSLSMASTGVFAWVTDLYLSDIRFHSPGELGDVVSSPWCLCLQNLILHNAQGLDNLIIHSDSLQLLHVDNLHGVQQVTVVAPDLKYLCLLDCFLTDQNQPVPVANISAPHLKFLKWVDVYDPSSVHLGSMEHLKKMESFFCVYGTHGFLHNEPCLMLLPQFKAIEYLILSLVYLPVRSLFMEHIREI